MIRTFSPDGGLSAASRLTPTVNKTRTRGEMTRHSIVETSYVSKRWHSLLVDNTGWWCSFEIKI